MTYCKMLILGTLVGCAGLGAVAQQRMIEDNGLKFRYSDSAGVTASYLGHFGDSLGVPSLARLDGGVIGPAELRGKVVVFNFWFTACKPCVAEIPVLNRLVGAYRSDSVVFVAVTWDKKEKIEAFLASRRFDFTIVQLGREDIQQMKKVSFYPLTAIVDRHGRISFVVFGRRASEGDEEFYAVLDRQLRRAMAE
jgi:thiol-disulfide isomerase/thioredoxin